MKDLTSGLLLNERYRLGEPLQQQSGRATWLARDTRTGQQVIVKMLDLGTMPDWDALKLFERELQVLTNLTHPRIPRLLEQFQTEAPPRRFLVLAYLAGESLRQRLQRSGPLTESQAKSMARQALEILVYLHGFSPPVIHRDLKPDNLLLDMDQLSLIDFGAVKDLGSSQGTVVGTFGYLAPEQLAGQAVPASDLYALGVTLTEALSGIGVEALPRDGLRIQLPKDLNVSIGFGDWLQELLAPEISLRFKSAGQALQALNALNARDEGAAVTAAELPAGSRLSLAAPSQDRLELHFGRKRGFVALLLWLVLPVALALTLTVPALFALFELGLFSPRLDPVSNLLQGRILAEWLPVLPVTLLIYCGFALQFYRLWFRTFSLHFKGSRMRCEARSGRKVYWEVELGDCRSLQILPHRVLVTLQANRFKNHQITVALTPAEYRVVKSSLRDYLRRHLPREKFRQLLPGLKS